MYSPAIGGAEVHLKEIAQRLVIRGHHVTILTSTATEWWGISSGRPELPLTEVIGGVTVRRFSPDGGWIGKLLDLWRRLPGGYRSVNWLLGEHAAEMISRRPLLPAIVPTLLRADVDVVIAFQWYWPTIYPVYLARKLKRFPLVGIPLFHVRESWCDHPFYKRMLSTCDLIITNTEHEAEFARRQGSNRAEVSGVGVEPAIFERCDGDRVRSEFGLDRELVVGFVGRRSVGKGLGTLLRAMKTVWQQEPRTRLVLAGPKHPLEQQLRDLLSGLSEAERDRLVWIDNFAESEKASLFDAFDVFVLPSTGESFGIAYLEAWMCKKPVIGARIESTACVIDDDVDGLLVNGDDHLDAARAILALLRDPALRETMGRRGYEKTLAKYTWEKVTDTVEQLCLQATGRRVNIAAQPAAVSQMNR
jgi:glycosyltransferase involved in cell wall biosynthesis